MEQAEISSPEQYLSHYRDFGYFVFRLSPDDLRRLQALVNASYAELVAQRSNGATAFSVPSIEQHHTLSGRFDHSLIGDPRDRLLSSSQTTAVRGLGFIAGLQDLFGDFRFGAARSVHAEELAWRVVRPDSPGDVGPWHVDGWFWDIGMSAGSEPANWVHRCKIWIPLFCQQGVSGLAIVPGSHRQEIPYRTEQRDGVAKPHFTGDIAKERQLLLSGDDGRAIMFHDRLLHRGIVNGGTRSRVSLEANIYSFADAPGGFTPPPR